MKLMSVMYVKMYLIFVGLQEFAFSLNEENYDTINNNKVGFGEHNLDDIRCFCNLPKCVTSGYMCRTKRGHGFGCFSELKSPTEEKATRHGCVDFLRNTDIKMHCDSSIRKNNLIESNRSTDNRLLCCHENMCNHVDNNKKVSFEKSDLLTMGNIHEEVIQLQPIKLQKSSTSVSTSSDDWFRYLVIVVPICGAFILFSLIAVAVKMLRSERSSASSKLNCSHKLEKTFPFECEAQTIVKETNQISNTTPYTSIKLCDKKNEARAKMNQLINMEYSLLPQNCNDPHLKLSNVEPSIVNKNKNKNVNISLGLGYKYKESKNKIYEKDVLSPLPVNWGDSCSSTYKSYEI